MKALKSQFNLLMQSLWVLLALAAFAQVRVHAESNAQALFDAGNEAFLKQEYAVAIESYEKAIAEQPSAALHYNLGNALHAAGQSGRAIAHFEKALALQPSLKEAAINLSIVRKSLEKPLSEPTPLGTLGQLMPLNQWVWLLAVTFWIAAFGYIAPMMPKKYFVWARTGAVVATLVVLVAALGCAYWYGQLSKGVVVANDTPLLASPSSNSANVAFAEMGQYVTIQRELPNFYLVETEAGKTGFVGKTAIETVWR